MVPPGESICGALRWSQSRRDYYSWCRHSTASFLWFFNISFFFNFYFASHGRDHVNDLRLNGIHVWCRPTKSWHLYVAAFTRANMTVSCNVCTFKYDSNLGVYGIHVGLCPTNMTRHKCMRFKRHSFIWPRRQTKKLVLKKYRNEAGTDKNAHFTCINWWHIEKETTLISINLM